MAQRLDIRNHPQLNRFKESGNPIGAIATYLRFVAEEAIVRKYNFNIEKICNKNYRNKIEVTSGQVQYEFLHLLSKLKDRDKERYKLHVGKTKIAIHPMFVVVKGGVEPWEIR